MSENSDQKQLDDILDSERTDSHSSNVSDKSEVDREYMDNVAMKLYAKLLRRLM